jgi:hypothetical protein
MSNTRNEYTFLWKTFMEDEERDGRVTYLYILARWVVRVRFGWKVLGVVSKYGLLTL